MDSMDTSTINTSYVSELNQVRAPPGNAMVFHNSCGGDLTHTHGCGSKWKTDVGPQMLV